MSKHSDKAVELFKRGYNCSQAVFGAFAEDLGIDFETAVKISSSFGGGMGRLREVCGALTGSFMVLGLKSGYSDASDYQAKKEHYRSVQELAKRFREYNGSIICREILGEKTPSEVPEKRTEEYYRKRPCVEIVRLSAEELDNFFDDLMANT